MTSSDVELIHFDEMYLASHDKVQPRKKINVISNAILVHQTKLMQILCSSFLSVCIWMLVMYTHYVHTYNHKLQQAQYTHACSVIAREATVFLTSVVKSI